MWADVWLSGRAASAAWRSVWKAIASATIAVLTLGTDTSVVFA